MVTSFVIIAFPRMSFGLRNAIQNLQVLIDKVLLGLLNPYAHALLVDVLIASNSF